MASKQLTLWRNLFSQIIRPQWQTSKEIQDDHYKPGDNSGVRSSIVTPLFLNHKHPLEARNFLSCANEKSKSPMCTRLMASAARRPVNAFSKYQLSVWWNPLAFRLLKLLKYLVNFVKLCVWLLRKSSQIANHKTSWWSKKLSSTSELLCFMAYATRFWSI